MKAASFALSLFAFSLFLGTGAGHSQKPGGFSDAPLKSPEVLAAATFAVKEQAAKDKEKLELVEVTKAQSQVVAGTNYKLTLKVDGAGRMRFADVVVWRKLDKTHELTSWNWRDGK